MTRSRRSRSRRPTTMPRQAKAAVDVPGDATTVDPNAAKVGHITPKPHVRE